MRLSPSFALSEFEKHGRVPAESISILAEFCGKILEPIRAKFGPITITSGYRPDKTNAATGGVTKSQHIYSPKWVAADIVPDTSTIPMSQIFDWIRLGSFLPVDQVILEKDKATGVDACIHLSYTKTPRHQALEGETHGTGGYQHVAFVTMGDPTADSAKPS